jgi:hypothetical protein
MRKKNCRRAAHQTALSVYGTANPNSSREHRTVPTIPDSVDWMMRLFVTRQNKSDLRLHAGQPKEENLNSLNPQMLRSQRVFAGSGTGLKFDRPLLQGSAGDLPCACSLEIPEQTARCEFGREPAIADVRKTVAVGVRAIRVRMPGQIGSETVRRGEAGAFTDQHQAEARSKTKPKRISNRNPALLHKSKRGEGPPRIEKLRKKLCKQRNDIPFDGQSGEAIGDDDGKVPRRGSKLRNRSRVQRPAKNRLAKIRSTFGSVALKLQHRNRRFPKDGQFGAEAFRKRRKV